MKLKGCNHQSPIPPVFRGIRCCPIVQIFSHEFINLLPSPCPEPGIGLFSLKEPRSVGNGGAGGCTCFGCILDKMGNINLTTNHWTTVIVGDILLVIYWLDQQESQDISGSEMNLASSPEKDLQIEIEGWLLNYQFVSSDILPRHLNF